MAGKSPLPGPNTLLLGPAGAGKTTALRTLADTGVTPFAIFTEPGFEVLGDLNCTRIHWRYIRPATQSWAVMLDSAKKLNTLSFATIAGLGDINKKDYNQFWEFLETCNRFKCDRCGTDFGDVATWGTDRMLVVDGLSGLSIMAMNLIVGSKPVKSQGEWGVAMDNLERLIQKLTTDLWCHFTLIAHVEREADEAMGTMKIMASTLGKRLAPKIPRFFSDVVLAIKDGNKFRWSTTAGGADLKTRYLQLSDALQPSFAPIVAEWRLKGGIIEVSPEASPLGGAQVKAMANR